MNQWINEASDENASVDPHGPGTGERVRIQLGDGYTESKMKHNKIGLY